MSGAAPAAGEPGDHPLRRHAAAHGPVVVAGNRVQLLTGGDAYFPQLIGAIEAARQSIFLETYIFARDNSGWRVSGALADAAARGVRVYVLVDGFGSGDTAAWLREQLALHGARVHVYRPPRWWRLDRRFLRRLHRKLVVIDDRVAFVGGINILDDYTEVPVMPSGRKGPRYDYAVRCEGPLVTAIAWAARSLWLRLTLVERVVQGDPVPHGRPPRQPPLPGGVHASLLLRDNLRHRRTIERAYLAAIECAQREIVLANAYFLPGRRLRTALRAAAARGVRVRLLLQGRVEYALQHYAQQALYGDLLAAGIEIHEYRPSYLHAKVAVVDGYWATVGSSNIDPYSLLLAREANVAVFDSRFAAQLQAELARAIGTDSVPLRAQDYARRGLATRVLNWIAYGVVRFLTVVLAQGYGY